MKLASLSILVVVSGFPEGNVWAIIPKKCRTLPGVGKREKIENQLINLIYFISNLAVKSAMNESDIINEMIRFIFSL